MKKVFVEPEMQIIELNLHENIASSEQILVGYNFLTLMLTCTVVYTGKTVWQVTETEAEGCAVYASAKARSITMFYPREEVLPHFKR